jgi:hypothetical protein
MHDGLMSTARHKGLADQWDDMEEVIRQTAQRLMGWQRPARPGELHGFAVPAAALHLALGDQPGAEREPILTGTLTRMRPIFDASSTKVRMRPDGGRCGLRLTPNHSKWSRDPRSL